MLYVIVTWQYPKYKNRIKKQDCSITTNYFKGLYVDFTSLSAALEVSRGGENLKMGSTLLLGTWWPYKKKEPNPFLQNTDTYKYRNT